MAKSKRIDGWRRVQIWARGTAYQLVRCSVVLVLVSGGAAVGTIARPGFGTKLGHFGTDYAVNTGMAKVLRSVMLPSGCM